jgi:DNA processing protein
VAGGLTPSDAGRAAYVALALTPGIGFARLATLRQAFTTAHGALAAPLAFLSSIPGVSKACATAIKSTSVSAGERVLGEVAQLGGRCLLPEDPDFPAALLESPEPPTLLFTVGDLSLLRRPAVAIVGSRDHSAYGAEACRMVAGTAAAAGVVVVSGMARGLDAVAHLAALDAGGGTIGILGNGLGVVYPAANRALYERVLADGLLLTEFPPGDRPHLGNFPRRNRLISGLARVTVVVEAAEGSGTLITVASALDQGREVMVVPGPITSRTSIGTNRLLRDGAAPYLEPADLGAYFPEAHSLAARGPAAPARPALPPGLALSEEERQVALALGPSAQQLDMLVEEVGLPVDRVLAVLCALELHGLVQQEPGRRFLRP